MNEPDDQYRAPSLSDSQEVLQSEIEEHLEIRQQRRWVFPRAAIVGMLTGFVALLFRIALTRAEVLRTGLISWSRALPVLGWAAPVLAGMIGAGLAVTMTVRCDCRAGGSGIPDVEAVLHGYRRIDWKRLLPTKFIGSVIAIGSGLALGREGPTIQMGGAIGEAVSEGLDVSGEARLTLISAGAGAGLAAAFNAPLAGLVFVLEEIRGDFQPLVLGAVLIASIVATVVARIGEGQYPVFRVPGYPVPPLGSLFAFAVLGVVAGVLGVAFNRGLLRVLDLYARVPARFTTLAAALAGAAIGLIGWFSPALSGSGNALVATVLRGDLVLSWILVFFAIRFLMTLSSYGTGAPGGIFAPLLVLGALIGLAIGQLAHGISPGLAPIPAAFAVVGMAAYFVAVVRAPLTGIVLITEMTGTYSYMLPLLVSCFAAYAVAEWLRQAPIYESLLERDLNAG